MDTRWFNVEGSMGGYENSFDWMDAENLAREESQSNGLRIITDENNVIVALFYNGSRYVPVTGAVCENCGKPLDEDQAHYTFSLTKRKFCSQSCGLELGVLRNERPD